MASHDATSSGAPSSAEGAAPASGMSPASWTRRRFLQIAAAGCLTACTAATPAPGAEPVTMPGPTARPDADAPEATATPSPTPTPKPTSTPRPTLDVRRPEVIQAYPEAASTVVHVHHAGVWSGDDLVPNALRAMLDASITSLTGLHDAREAWAALFDPGERIAIKVNAFRNSTIWTHVPLVTAVTDALQAAGVPAENILLFDFYTSELEEAGFTVNPDGPGVRCAGTDRDYTSGFEVQGVRLDMSNRLLSCDALINMPVLKSHMITGFTFALKNHYGTINNPALLHDGDRLNWGMPELNALPEVRDRTRLVIGDALTANLHYANSWPYWEPDYRGDSILMSFDSVAADAVGFRTLTDLLTADGGNADAAIHRATPWLANARELGLGTSNFDEIDLVELNL